MLEYIYFVKCPDCEDEHFDFFSEAKDYAMRLLSKKPIITQIEVDRNDFGECIDSCDLGTVWSWEEAMGKLPVESDIVFDKADTLCDCGGTCGDNCTCGKHHSDPEFDALDNSLEIDFRKPVPDNMSIKDLVEAMEANEDTVECVGCEELFPKADCFFKDDIGWLCGDCEDRIVKCTWCEELYDRSDCRKEVDLGWLCNHCQAAIKSRGEQLTFTENSYWDFLDEAMDPHDLVELEYPSLTVTLYGPKRDVDDWDEFDHTDSFVFLVPRVEVATAIWENWITEEDVADVEGGLEALEDDIAWEKFLETHFDILFEKYNKQILKHFEDEAKEDFRERSQEEYGLDRWSADIDQAYDAWRDEKYFGESFSEIKPFLTESNASDKTNSQLVDCPECGVIESFDRVTGSCTNCGFNI